jgi:Pirin
VWKWKPAAGLSATWRYFSRTCSRRAAELASTLAPDLDQPGVPEALLARYLVARGDARAGRELAERIVGRRIYAEDNAFEILAMLDALVALETVTYMFDGILRHQDSNGGGGLITDGDTQWMTAGAGLSFCQP